MKIEKTQIYREAEEFLSLAFVTLQKHQVQLQRHWDIDHICYRTSSEENYELAKSRFSAFSTLLAETDVNGRMIATFQLAEPIFFEDWQIDLVEVPAPKKGKSHTDGFEHFEVVCDWTFDELAAAFPNCRSDDSGLIKDLNQELAFKFDNFSVKFHHISLKSVINIETNDALMLALQRSEILRLLRSYRPLIAGSFPLGLQTSTADCDILIDFDDIDKTEHHLRNLFSKNVGFEISRQSAASGGALVVSFEVERIRFEIFCQKIPSVHQPAYKYFLIEERILKYGGQKFFDLVLKERENGKKTEAAFACVLNLTGNPYEAMSQLQTMSRSEILERIRSVLPLRPS